MLHSDGSVWAWGGNAYGQLGNGTVEPRTTPAPVSRVKGNAVALAAGAYNSMAMLANGTTLSWGSNSWSKIGNGVRAVHVVPSRVRMPCRFRAVDSEDHRESHPREPPPVASSCVGGLGRRVHQGATP